MSPRDDGDGNSLPSPDSTFYREDVSMDLTMCGLLTEKAEKMARLYATHRDWTIVEDRWFDERLDGRSTRGSSRKVYRILSSRFKTADESLPSIARLPAVFSRCETDRDKAQVLYFYLVEADPLVEFVVHEYARRMREQGLDELDFDQDVLEVILGEFQYADGEPYDYAASTTARWGEGLRSVMREIDVLETQQSFQGRPPNVGTVPLLVSAGYSWERAGTDWLAAPLGLLYLFQPEPYWESLLERVGNHNSWEATGLHGDVRLEPVDETYGWAEPVEGDA